MQADNLTSNRALGFLVWFRKRYKGKTEKTFRKIAKDYEQARYGTVRKLIIELNNRGFIRCNGNLSDRSWRFRVDEERFQELL